MPHSWKAFEIAKRITEALKESGYVTTSFEELKVRGIIQIILEEIKMPRPKEDETSMINETKIEVDEDKKGVLWLRASPVNLVVSISDKKIGIWTCKRGCKDGENVFNLWLVKKGDNWLIKNFECEEVEKYAKTEK